MSLVFFVLFLETFNIFEINTVHLFFILLYFLILISQFLRKNIQKVFKKGKCCIPYELQCHTLFLAPFRHCLNYLTKPIAYNCLLIIDNILQRDFFLIVEFFQFLLNPRS